MDLLGQANNRCFLAMLGSSIELQPGSYQQIRVVLASDTTPVKTNLCGSKGHIVGCVSTWQNLELGDQRQKFWDYFAAFGAFLMPLLHFDLYPIVDERFRGSFP